MQLQTLFDFAVFFCFVSAKWSHPGCSPWRSFNFRKNMKFCSALCNFWFLSNTHFRIFFQKYNNDNKNKPTDALCVLGLTRLIYGRGRANFSIKSVNTSPSLLKIAKDEAENIFSGPWTSFLVIFSYFLSQDGIKKFFIEKFPFYVWTSKKKNENFFSHRGIEQKLLSWANLNLLSIIFVKSKQTLEALDGLKIKFCLES